MRKKEIVAQIAELKGENERLRWLIAVHLEEILQLKRRVEKLENRIVDFVEAIKAAKKILQ